MGAGSDANFRHLALLTRPDLRLRAPSSAPIGTTGRNPDETSDMISIRLHLSCGLARTHDARTLHFVDVASGGSSPAIIRFLGCCSRNSHIPRPRGRPPCPGFEYVPQLWNWTIRNLRLPSWWKKPLKEIPATFNARAEKPMFRGAFNSRRCIMPASGFYEWTGKAGAKTPHYFSAPSGEPLALAGLWEH